MPDNSIIRTDERLIQKDMEQLQLTDDQFKVAFSSIADL